MRSKDECGALQGIESSPQCRDIEIRISPRDRCFHAAPVNLLESYTPPSLGAPTVTQYQFNFASQPTTVTRADAQQITWTYDAAGRPATLTTPSGVTTYTYNPTTGQLASLASPSGGLVYSYDGALQKGETASGFTVGAVSWDYDASFRVTTERVNGANPITFTYDTDSPLTGAGAVTYTRRATDGLLLTATLGSTATAFSYNGFGRGDERDDDAQRRGALRRRLYARCRRPHRYAGRDDRRRDGDRSVRLRPRGSIDHGDATATCWRRTPTTPTAIAPA